MEIKESVITHYLADITISWFNENEYPPDELHGYAQCVNWMKGNAEKRGELDLLKLAFEHILANPDVDCERLAGGRYPYDDEEMREIIEYAWQKLWPDAPPIPDGGPPDVTIVPW